MVPNLHGFADRKHVQDYASTFVKHYFDIFLRDIRICLRTDDKTRAHAYMPALITNVAHWEFAAGLMIGKLWPVGQENMTEFGRQFMHEFERNYGQMAVAVILKAYRNKIAHSGHPFIPTRIKFNREGPEYRFAFQFDEYLTNPTTHLDLIMRDRPPRHCPLPPWKVSVDARMRISLPAMANDIRHGADNLVRAVGESDTRAERFVAALREFHPPN